MMNGKAEGYDERKRANAKTKIRNCKKIAK